MYFLRGAGTDGIGGIRARRGDGVVRPLLCVLRSEIEAFLEQMKQTYVTDATNKSDAYTRNRIRNRLLPSLRRTSLILWKRLRATQLCLRLMLQSKQQGGEMCRNDAYSGRLDCLV